MTAAPIPLLNHGYVRFIEAWGHGDAGVAELDRHLSHDYFITEEDNECGIVEAARMSTQASFRGWEQDEKLLRHLYCSNPKHATPFEFAGMTIEVQAPILVFREWHRHRTQSYNEMSARYAPLPNQNYIPNWNDVKRRGERAESTRNKQEAGTSPWDVNSASAWWVQLPTIYDLLEKLYQEALSAGVPKELARITLPVGRYSRMRASGNLRNWLAFMTLRADPGAQEEIRIYAEAVGTIIAKQFPRTWKLFKGV